MGIDSSLHLREPTNSPNWGKKRPRSKPTTIHMAIHNVKYFSKTPSVGLLLVSDGDACAQANISTSVTSQHWIQIFKSINLNLFLLAAGKTIRIHLHWRKNVSIVFLNGKTLGNQKDFEPILVSQRCRRPTFHLFYLLRVPHFAGYSNDETQWAASNLTLQ